MARIRGIVDHEGHTGGFTSEGVYRGSSELGISLTSNQGGLSGIVEDNIYIETKGYISGIAGEDIGLSASGSQMSLICTGGRIFQKASDRIIIDSGEKVDINAVDDFLLNAQDATISLTQGFTVNAISDAQINTDGNLTLSSAGVNSLQSTSDDVEISSIENGVSGVANGFFGIRAGEFIHIETVGAGADILINSDDQIEINSDNKQIYRASDAIEFQANGGNMSFSTPAGSEWGGSFNFGAEGGTGELAITTGGNTVFSCGGMISGTATSVGFRASEFLHIDTQGASANIFINSDNNMIINADATLTLQANTLSLDTTNYNLNIAGHISGVAGTFAGISSEFIHLYSEGANAEILMNSDDNLSLYGDGDISIGNKLNYATFVNSSSISTFFGNGSYITIGGIGAPVTIHGGNVNIESSILDLSISSLTASITGNCTIDKAGLDNAIFAVDYTDINLLGGSAGSNGILMRSDKNIVLQTTGASDNIIMRPHSGKTIFTKIAEDNRAPINISGVPNVLDNFANSETEGDLGYTSASNDIDRGQGRLWMSTGSGIAPIAIGSGVMQVRSSANTVIAGTGGAYTSITFGTNDIIDRQYQKNSTTAVAVTQNGLYAIEFAISFQNASATTFAGIDMAILINGSATQVLNTSVNSTSYGGRSHIGGMIYKYLNAGDTIGVGASKIVGTGATIYVPSGRAWITARQIRPNI